MRKNIQTLNTARKLIVLAGVIFAVVVAMPQLPGANSVLAASKKKDNSTPANGTGNSLRVSPTRTDAKIQKGTTGKVTVRVTNLSDEKVNLQPLENDFVTRGEDGKPSLILDANQYAPTHSLKRFMAPLKDITLKPHETKAVTVSITVPANAQSGGYFGALRFVSATTKSTTTTPQALKPSVASLILLTVPGPVPEQLILTNFDVKQNGNPSNNFRTPNNLDLLVRFENKGGIQEAPFGQIQVTKGDKLVYTYDFNQKEPKQEILPDSARRWNVPLKGIGWFGKYTISGTFGYGNGKSIQVSKTIWVIPTVFIIGALVILIVFIIGLILLFIVIGKRRKDRKKNKSSR